MSNTDTNNKLKFISCNELQKTVMVIKRETTDIANMLY
jgi:hypothetical protein